MANKAFSARFPVRKLNRKDNFKKMQKKQKDKKTTLKAITTGKTVKSSVK